MMRSRLRRHIGMLLSAEPEEHKPFKGLLEGEEPSPVRVPPEFTPHQYLIMLLHIAATIEHALMVEYLYAGFSLGGPHVPPDHQIQVAQWQETILGIAKEEMGHLMTIQNLLRCLGGPLNLDREDYPWDSELYPFRFRLEPLTWKSLARYVYVESPGDKEWTGPLADEIRAIAQDGGAFGPVHRVGVLYDLVAKLIADPNLIPDADFRPSTYPFQANWDEWGRGYRAGARGNSSGVAMPGTPDVLILALTSRTDALAAVTAIATQGEANPTASDGQPSHFARFLKIFEHFPNDASWSPSRNVPVNPIVVSNVGADETGKGEVPPGEQDDPIWEGTAITHKQGKVWGHLFNTRYQILLTSLLHTFEYPSSLVQETQVTPRGLLLHSTFGEMYNLRALSQILMQMPLTDGEKEKMAGPPFQMPFTLRLPIDATDRWRLHLDLLAASKTLADCLLQLNPGGHATYLLALKEADSQTASMIEKILSGHSAPVPMVKTRY